MKSSFVSSSGIGFHSYANSMPDYSVYQSKVLATSTADRMVRANPTQSMISNMSNEDQYRGTRSLFSSKYRQLPSAITNKGQDQVSNNSSSRLSANSALNEDFMKSSYSFQSGNSFAKDYPSQPPIRLRLERFEPIQSALSSQPDKRVFDFQNAERESQGSSQVPSQYLRAGGVRQVFTSDQKSIYSSKTMHSSQIY